MFKKISSVVAAVAMTLAGLGALPAQAVNYTPNPDSGYVSQFWNGSIQANGEFQIPTNTERFSIGKSFSFFGTEYTGIYGKTVSFDWSLTKPDGSVVTGANSGMSNFSASSSASLQGSGNAQIYPNSGTNLLITSSVAGLTEAVIYFNIYSSGSTTAIAAGTYTLSVAVKVDGVEFTNFTTNGDDAAWVSANTLSITGKAIAGDAVNLQYLGQDRSYVSAKTCADTNSLAVGDTINIRTILDGAVSPRYVSGSDRYINLSEYASNGNNWINSTTSENATVVTVTQGMIDNGLSVKTQIEFLNPNGADPDLSQENSFAEGNRTLGISITNAGGTEISAACTPPTAPALTATPSGTSVNASATGVFYGSGTFDYSCQAYKVSDNTPVGSETYANRTGWNNGTYSGLTCGSIYDIPGGTNVVVKIIAKDSEFTTWRSLSAASNAVTVQSSGITITSTASNGTNFGQVKALPSFDQLVLAGAGTQSTVYSAEPTGGNFIYDRKSANVAVRRVSATGLDANFGTQALTAPTSSFTFSTGWHGLASAPRPLVGFSTQSMSSELTIKDLAYNGGAGDTRTVTNAQLVALCTSAFDGNFGSAIQSFVMSSPTADVYFQTTCVDSNFKEGWLVGKVSMSGAGAPTLVTKLNTPTADLPGLVVSMGMSGAYPQPYSVNPLATGSAAMITLLVTPAKMAAQTVFGAPQLIRIPATGATPAAINSGIPAPATASGANWFVTLPHLNSGTTVVSTTMNICSPQPCTATFGNYKLPATGAASALTPVWDSSAGFENGTSRLVNIVGITSDGQVIGHRYLQQADPNNPTTSITKLRLAKVNLSTGAATTFGELYSYTRSGNPTAITMPIGTSGAMFMAQSATNTGKFDLLLISGQSNTPTPTPTVPVPNGDANTDLGRSLNAGGLKLEITGTGLTAVTSVKFGTVTAKITKTATKLTITVPAGLTGTSAVTVLHAGGSISVGNWEYMGATKRSQTLTETGLGDPTHSGATEANRNFSVASSLDGYSVTVVSKSTSVCTYVSGVLDFIGNGTCVLEAKQLGDAVTNASTKTYEIYYETEVNASALYSTDAGKPTITISGEGLSSVSKVIFGNIEVVPTKKTATSITVKVPAAPTSGANVDVQLKYNNGTVVDTDLDFDYVGTVKLNQVLFLGAGFATATYGDPARTLTARSEDGNGTTLPDMPHVFSTTTPSVCAVAADQLRFLGEGTCTVKVTQAGNAGVNAATPVTFNITVSPKSQTIEVDESARNITDAEGVNLGATNSNEEVLLEYVSSNELICTVDGEGYVTGLAEGTCTITINAPGDARYSAATEKSVTVNVAPGEDPLPDAPDVVDADPISISNGGAGTFISLSDPSLQVSWDKAAGKLTPRATGVYTGTIVAELKFTKNGVNYVCTTVFGSTSKLTNPKKPAALPNNASAKAVAAYAKAMAAYKVAYNKVWGSKVFASKNFCTDTVKMKSATALNPFGTSFAVSTVKTSKTTAEKNAEKLALNALKGFTGDVTITVKRWRAWPTTMKNKTGSAGTGKTIPATKNVNTLTLG